MNASDTSSESSSPACTELRFEMDPARGGSALEDGVGVTSAEGEADVRRLGLRLIISTSRSDSSALSAFFHAWNDPSRSKSSRRAGKRAP